jgi:hypothetical protein
MFLATHGILAKSASGAAVDPDAQAFITAASITNPTQQAAINTLVTDLKGYSIWSKMKALYPFVGGTAAQHKWNLKDPRDLDAAFRLVFSGGYTHNSNGITGNGTNAYADTKLIPNANLTQNSSHASVYSRTNKSNSNECLIGSATSAFSSNGLLILAYANDPYIMVNNSTLTNGTGFNTTGLLTASRITSTNQKLYRNTSTLINATSNSTGLSNGRILLNAFVENNVSISRYSPHNLAFASIGDGLSDTEAANLYTAVQAFQTTLGRSIGTQTVSDADAQAFVTNAGIVDQVEANAINNLVIGMKADGLWTKMKAVYPFVGGSSTSHSYNLRNTAQYQISWSGGITHSSNGVQFGGVNGLGNTGYNLSTNASLNSHSISVYSRTTGTTGTQCELGVTGGIFDGGSGIFLRESGTTTLYRVNSQASYTTNSNTDSRGFYLANRTASNVINGWKNSTKVVTGTTVSYTPLANFNYYIGAFNSNGSPNFYSAKQIAFASIGDGLTDTDATNLNTRVTTFQTALNRNV